MTRDNENLIPFTEEENIILRRSRRGGQSARDAAVKLGRSEFTVRRQAEALGIAWRKELGTSQLSRFVVADQSAERKAEMMQREADERFQRKLFEAMWNGDHLPAGQAKPVRPLVLTP